MPALAITMTGLNLLKLQPKGALPANSNKLVTKGELNTYFYVDNDAAGITSLPDNRIITHEQLANSSFAKPSTPFYQYDVYRSGIPNANGAYFNYIGSDLQSHQVLQNSYGYVGRFCMQENSYRNNQWGVYTFSYAGPCYPNYSTYPQPYIVGNYLYFNNLANYSVEDLKVYQIANYEEFKNDAITNANLLGAGLTAGVLVLIGSISAGAGLIFTAIEAGLSAYYNTSGSTSVNSTSTLRYTQTGIYYNGTLNMSTIKNASLTNRFFFGYKVKDSFGNYPITFGFQSGQSTPPGLTY